MDPISLGSLGIQGLSAVMGGIGSFITGNQSKKIARMQISAQKEENATTRQFNHDEAALARQYNSQLINQQNEYNTPQAQMQRYTDAGLNPNLIYGSVSNGSVGLGSTSMTASSSGSVSPASQSPIDMLGAASILSDIGLKLAETKKLESETENTNINNDYAAELARAQIANLNENTRFKFTERHLTLEQIKVASAQFDNLKSQAIMFDATASKTANETEGVKLENLIKGFEHEFTMATYGARVRKFMAETHLSESQALQAAKLLPLVISYQQLQNSSLKEQIGKYIQETRNLEILNLIQGVELDSSTLDLEIKGNFAYIDKIAEYLETAFGIYNQTRMAGKGRGRMPVKRHKHGIEPIDDPTVRM